MTSVDEHGDTDAVDEDPQKGGPRADTDAVLAEFLGERDWTTAEELFSRPITLPSEHDVASDEHAEPISVESDESESPQSVEAIRTESVAEPERSRSRSLQLRSSRPRQP